MIFMMNHRSEMKLRRQRVNLHVLIFFMLQQNLYFLNQFKYSNL
jgi:hypothetical protein